MKLAVILGTVREGRKTEHLSKWVVNTANAMEKVDAEHLDLKDYPLTFFDELVSPRFNPARQPNDATKKWLDKVEVFDAYIFVTPEYNHSVPGVLKNAIDYLDFQIAKKPVTIVSHGSVGGARATMHLKDILSESRAAVIPTQVAFHGRVGELIDENGNLNEESKVQEHGPQTALIHALTELKWYSDALSAARAKDA